MSETVNLELPLIAAAQAQKHVTHNEALAIADALIHLAVPSVSGQAVLTMPLFVPLADLLRLSRQVPVIAYQTGAGLSEMIWPTNGALMAVLLAAGVPYPQWIRFVAGGAAMSALLGIAGIVAVMWLHAA